MRPPPDAPRAVIGIMAKAPRPGRAKTRLSPAIDPAAAARLAHAFLLDTVTLVAHVARARGALLYSPRGARHVFRRIGPGFLLVPQGPGDLGRRLAAAFDRLFRRGAGPVILIGADTPTLPRAVLERALRVLDDPATDVVLGPSEDGGDYLIGRRAPRAALFEDGAWSTASVFSATLARARAARLRVVRLRRWWDVDTPDDLARLQRWLAGRSRSTLPATRRALAALAQDARGSGP